MNNNLLNRKTANDDFYSDAKYVDGEKLEYEILFGNQKIVFIKAGAGGNACGYDNKYLKMARRVHERVGATVICASNPFVSHEEVDEAEIKWVVAEKGLSNFEISFVGASDGAHHNLLLAKRFPETVKWLGINTSYINIEDLQKKLLSLSNIYKILICGTKDDDFNQVVPAISKITGENLVMKLIDGADHNFTGMVEEFISLIDYLN